MHFWTRSRWATCLNNSNYKVFQNCVGNHSHDLSEGDLALLLEVLLADLLLGGLELRDVGVVALLHVLVGALQEGVLLQGGHAGLLGDAAGAVGLLLAVGEVDAAGDGDSVALVVAADSAAAATAAAAAEEGVERGKVLVGGGRAAAEAAAAACAAEAAAAAVAAVGVPALVCVGGPRGQGEEEEGGLEGEMGRREYKGRGCKGW